jgi:anti-sigma factor RsiW
MTDDEPLIVDITCSDAVELVTDYLDEALSNQDLDRFEHHLATCEGCAVFVDQIKMTITLTSAVSNQQLELLPGNFDELVRLLADLGTE